VASPHANQNPGTATWRRVDGEFVHHAFYARETETKRSTGAKVVIHGLVNIDNSWTPVGCGDADTGSRSLHDGLDQNLAASGILEYVAGELRRSSGGLVAIRLIYTELPCNLQRFDHASRNIMLRGHTYRYG
jgi:hypothetical protein